MSKKPQPSVVELDNDRLLLKEMIISFPKLFRPSAFKPGDAEAWESSFLYDADAEDVTEAVRAKVSAVAEEKWPKKTPKGLKFPLASGDDKDYEGYAGRMVIKARRAAETRKGRQTPPVVVDQAKDRLTEDDGKPDGGDIVNAVIRVYAQDNEWGKRINFSLESVQFVRHHESYGTGGKPSADPFDVIEEADEIAGDEDWAA